MHHLDPTLPRVVPATRTLAGATLLLGLLVLGLIGCSDEPADGPGDDAVAADASAAQDGLAVDAGGDATAEVENGVSSCPPGLAGCIDEDRVVCNEAGTGFALEACGEGLRCQGGTCVACVDDADCEPGSVCTDAGACVAEPLTMVTQALPPALLGTTYAQQLEAAGGKPPYSFSLDQGLLPDGLLLAPDGAIGGVATTGGKQSFAVKVEDAAGATAVGILVIEVKAGGLIITTTSPLPKATEGKPYNVQVEASGGEKPYFFGLTAGGLPKGLSLGADGSISGTPTEDGTFSFDLKALDNGNPPATTVRSFELPVGLAPLAIVGKQEVNLFITKIIVLPLIVVVSGVPVPYSTALEATGGKKPYAWSEVPLPGAVKSFIPNAGLPKGLSLGKDGKISGSVTDPKLAVKVQVPLTQITLEGFFFAAEVEDSQSPGKKKSAIFIIPTAPIGN